MEKLYYENPYKKEFIAEIVDVIEKDGKYHVELDQSYFFPNSEDQNCDIGFINEVPVSYVYEASEKTYHVIDIKPLKIHRVKCTIDFHTKYDYMQQHLGQHLLSACFAELFAINTIKSKIETHISYIDIDKSMTDNEIIKIEEVVNNLIFENISVQAFYPTNAELKKLNMKKSNVNRNEVIRLIKIGELTIFPSKALYPNSTIEIQAIKILKVQKVSNNFRVEFICGSRTIFDYFYKYKIINTISKLLVSKETDLIGKVEGVSGELKAALVENVSLRAKVSDYEVRDILATSENLNGIRIYKCIYEEVDIKRILNLATKLVAFPKVLVLLGIKNLDKTQLIFMHSKDINQISMNLLLKDAITLIDGKGGGSDFSAQGAGKNSNNLSSCLEYAYKKVKDSIL